MRVFFCVFLILFLSCSNNDSETPATCDSVIFDESKFNASDNFGIQLIDYELVDYCLKVTLGISGCDDDHTIEMVSNGAVSPSSPTIVFFDFYDENPQLCEAYFNVEREFDLEPIKTKYKEDVIVRFRNNQGSIQIDQ